jgi:hypothetical protein
VEVEDADCFSQNKFCAIAIEGKEKMLEDMSNEVFEQNKLVMANLFLALEDLVIFNMAEEKIAKGMWLCDIYEGKSMSNWIHLRRNLYNLRMKESSLFQAHLNEFNALVNKWFSCATI